jgi:hypothetical protein
MTGNLDNTCQKAITVSLRYYPSMCLEDPHYIATFSIKAGWLEKSMCTQQRIMGRKTML